MILDLPTILTMIISAVIGSGVGILYYCILPKESDRQNTRSDKQ